MKTKAEGDPMTSVQRRRLMPRAWLALAAGVSVGVLAACGNVDQAGANADLSTGSTASSTDLTATSSYSPLAQYLSPSGGENMSQDEFSAKDQQVQGLIAPCMAAQGFDYIPFVYPAATAPLTSDQGSQSRDYVAKYGYGISIDASAATSTSSSSDVQDPNETVVQAMDQTKQDAYYGALYGNGGIFAPSAAESAADQTTAADPAADQGCYGQAQAQVYGDQTTSSSSPVNSAQFDAMWTAYGALFSNIDKDPRLVQAVQAWVGCMSAAGYPDLTTVQDAVSQVNQKWADLNGLEVQTSAGGIAVDTTAAETTVTSATPPDAAKVTGFQAYEIKIALADFDCKAAGNYNSVAQQVRVELEQQFISDHKDELERYRALITGGG